MRKTPWWELCGWLGVGVALGIVLGSIILRDARAPFPIPLATAALIGVFAAVLGWLGWDVRKMKKNQRTRLNPLVAARVAALAFSSSRGGAVLTGTFSLLALMYWHSGTSAYVSDQVIAACASAAASLILMAVGRIVESWCRTDSFPDAARDAA